MATTSTKDDTPNSDGYLGADENVNMGNLTMDGHNSEEEMFVDQESSGADEDPCQDDRDSDGNSSATSLADNPLDHATMRKALSQFSDIISENEKMAGTIKTLERRQVKFRQAYETHKDIDSKLRKVKAGMHQLGCDLKKKRDYDAIEAEHEVIKEANKRLRLELDETKAQLQKELGEKTGYNNIKKERTEYHRQLKEKTINCTALEKEVAELRRKLNVEASFAAQTMAMFSTKSET